jgi:hypothetical protein
MQILKDESNFFPIFLELTLRHRVTRSSGSVIVRLSSRRSGNCQFATQAPFICNYLQSGDCHLPIGSRGRFFMSTPGILPSSRDNRLILVWACSGSGNPLPPPVAVDTMIRLGAEHFAFHRETPPARSAWWVAWTNHRACVVSEPTVLLVDAARRPIVGPLAWRQALEVR